MADVLQGVAVSPGVAVGQVWVLHPQLLPVVAEPVPPERVQDELDRLERAQVVAREEVAELKGRVRELLGESYAGILDAQLLILEDPGLVRETQRRIRIGRVSASWALKESVGEFLRRFEAVDDAYLRQRGGELEDVHRRLQRLLRGRRGGSGPPGNGPLIAVARTLGPSDAVALVRRGTVGLATDVGGPTSHTAILAQALSVTAVAGLQEVSRRVADGDTIVVDGDKGRVLVRPTSAQLAEAREQQQTRREREATFVRPPDGAAVTRDGVTLELRANIEFPSEADAALRFGARGIGLYRSEFLFLSHAPRLPDERQHLETYVEIAQKVAPHPAVLRTLDLGGEKYFHEVLDRDESNPVLGLRGVRLCLKRPDIFRPQLRGLLRAAAQQSNLSMMLPLVVSPEEVWEVRKLLAEEAEALKAEGQAARADVPLGIMIEVPAAAASADLLAGEADFFSVGTNDLIQYSLAIDRGNESVAYLYQPLHPGLLRMLRFVAESARARGIPVSLCGEMAADPSVTALLLGLGYRELSVQPRAIPALREAIAGLDAKQAGKLAEEALEHQTAEEVARRLRSMA